MSENTKIEWTDHTGSPFLGCSPVSPGCGNCYAWALAESRLEPIFRKAYKAAGFADWDTRPVWGEKATRVLSKGFWTQAVAINRKHAKAGTQGTWFPSMMDWLDDMPAGIIDQDGRQLDPVEVMADFLRLVEDTPNLVWLLLTKRPENWRGRLEAVCDVDGDSLAWSWLRGNAPANVRIGTSVENQEWADRRIPELLKIPAAGGFLSMEPLLGSVDLVSTGAFGCDCLDIEVVDGSFEVRCSGCCKFYRNATDKLSTIHWVICGGESGPGSRPCNVEWIRSIVRQCKAADVATFVKQLGARPEITPQGYDPVSGRPQSPMRLWGIKHPKGGEPAEWPEDLRVREFPEGLR